MDESLLIVDGAALSVRRGAADAPGIVVGDVGGKSTECSWLSGILIDVGKELCRWALVVGPAKPTCMTCIKVHGDVGQVQFRDSVVCQADICVLGLGALGNIQVGDEVSQRVRLWRNG